MKKILILFLFIFLFPFISFANSDIALKYNIIPDFDSKNYSIIDPTFQTSLNFHLYSNEETIYFNGTKILVKDNKFNIASTNLLGKQDITFTNNNNEKTIFTYYFANTDGLIQDYSLENNQAYIKTIDGIKIIYTSIDSEKINYISELIKKLPTNLKTNLTEITLFPSNHPSNAAGITNYNKIMLYNISTYTHEEIQRIVIHEIAHTWAHELRKNKIIDYSFTDFQKAVKSDNNFVTNYSKNSLSEDFADSIAFYLLDIKSFTKNFPTRTAYISNLLEN